jgi:hypothetical protein
MGLLAADLSAQTNGLATRRAQSIEDRRVETPRWNGSGENDLMSRRFPLQSWDKHFSSVGSKRAPIEVSAEGERMIFQTDTVDMKTLDLELSRWNERMADLHEQAGITLDERAQVVADAQLYHMVTTNAEAYREMGETLSLRDLNRYQFRRNRPDDGIPVEAAGSGE